MSNPAPTLPPTPSTIANLPQGTSPLSGNESVPISQNGVTVRVASNQFSVVGPTGPAGATGATGATGPQGPAGGAANINTGTINQIAIYNTTTTLSGTNALPNGTTATTQITADASTKVATTAFVNQGGLTLGTSTATTQSALDNSTKVATTAYTDAAVAANPVRITLATVVIDSTDIVLSGVPTQTNVGSSFVTTIPTKGLITWSFDAEIIVGTAAASFVFGIRIGSTNYWPTNNYGGTTAYALSGAPGGTGTYVYSSLGVLGGYAPSQINGSVNIGASLCGIFIEGNSVPTGSQTVQIIAGMVTSSGTCTLKGTVVPTRVYINIENHT